MAENRADGSWIAGLRQNLKQIGPVRLAATILFLLLALGLARYSWQLPLSSDAERALYDMRYFRSVERVDQDPRIVLVY